MSDEQKAALKAYCERWARAWGMSIAYRERGDSKTYQAMSDAAWEALCLYVESVSVDARDLRKNMEHALR